MNSKPSMTEIATDRSLWEQYVDPQNNDPAAFDRMTVEEKIDLQRELWPDEAAAEAEPQRYEWIVLRFFITGSRSLGEVKLRNCTDAEIQAAADAWTKAEFPSYRALPRWGTNANNGTNEFGPNRVLYTISQTD